MEAAVEAEKKRVDEGTRIFQVWWADWLKAQKEDREDLSMFSVRRPSALMAEWREWESGNEDLFMELHDSVCHQKMKELLLNNWKKKKVEQKLEEDMELMTYSQKYKEFRNCWEKKFPQHGQFEDITKKLSMQYSCGPVHQFMFEGPRPRTLQIFSAKILSSSWPLEVYGLIAIRDFIDPQRIMVFNQDREDYKIITEEDPYLPLSGPTRAVVVEINESMGPVTIEAELRVRGAVESEDSYIILDAISLSTLSSRSFELAGPNTKLEVSFGSIQRSVEATIFIRVVNGMWPIDFHGQFVAKTAMECKEVILLKLSGDGKMKQLRSVMSVEASGSLMITLKASGGEEISSVIFNAFDRGVSSGNLNLDSCSVEVLIGWSLISPYCVELVPSELMKLFNLS